MRSTLVSDMVASDVCAACAKDQIDILVLFFCFAGSKGSLSGGIAMHGKNLTIEYH